MVVLRLLLHIWSGCGGLLNGVAVADVKCCCMGGRALPCLVKMFQHQRLDVLLPAML
jgi:hypothetical protein